MAVQVHACAGGCAADARSLGVQFVRRMGYQTSKAMVMFRPRGDMEVLKEFPGDSTPRICPATVCDKLHVGYMIKYWLQVDDGAVRCVMLSRA